MGSRLSIGLFSTEADRSQALRDLIAQIDGLDLTLDTGRWEDLENALVDATLGIVLVNLDNDTEFGKQVVRRVLRVVPDISIIGVSARTDPETIISAMRAGCSQFVCAPVDVEDFRNAVERIRSTRLAVPHRSQRVCMVGASGGVGGTTLSCNLSTELAQLTHHTCALVDLDLEYGDAAFAFDCEPKFSLADICGTGSPIDRTMVESAVHQLPCNVALLGRPSAVADARLVTPDGVEQALRVLGAMFPYVVVDLPRAYSFLSSAALNDAEIIMIIAQLSIPSIRNASRVFDVLVDMGAREENIEIVLNRCRAEHQRVTTEDVALHFRRPVFAMIPNDYRRVTAALDYGHPIMADASNSPVRLAIQDLAETIVNGRRGGEKPPATVVNKGMFRRWWGGSKREAKAVGGA